MSGWLRVEKRNSPLSAPSSPMEASQVSPTSSPSSAGPTRSPVSEEKKHKQGSNNIMDKLHLKKKRQTIQFGKKKPKKDGPGLVHSSPSISKPTFVQMQSMSVSSMKVENALKLEREQIIISPREKKKKNRTDGTLDSATNHPYYIYLRVFNNLMDAMGLEEDLMTRIEDIVISSREMKSKKATHLSTVKELNYMKEIQKDVNLFVSFQELNQNSIIIQKLYRRYRAHKRMEFVRENYNKQKVSAFQDIVKREKKYIFNLATIVSQFIMPLRITADKQLRELQSEFKIIFSNIEDILSVHQMILTLIRSYSDTYWPQIDWFGDLICENSHYFKAYAIYVNNFKFANDTLLDGVMKNPKFAEFIENKTATLGMDLNMLLSLPLNHMAGYEMHLEKLLELYNTEGDEGSSLSLISALTLITETNNSIRNALAKSDKIASIQRIRKLFPENNEIEIFLSNSSLAVISEKLVDIIISKKSTLPGILILFNHSCIIGTQINKSNWNSGYNLKYIYSLDITRILEDESDPLSFELHVVNEETSNYGNQIIDNSRFHIQMKDTSSFKKLYAEIQGLISQNQRHRTFGVDLEYLIEREKPPDGIPRVVKDLVEYLVGTALETVGLFRIPGSSSEIKRLKGLYNNSYKTHTYPNLYNDGVRAHDAAGLLKMFFNELPTPLSTFELFDPLLETQSKYSSAEIPEMLADIKKLIISIPYSYFNVLKYMMLFFLKLIEHQEINKMGSMNIALCFGANIIRPVEQTVESALCIPLANGVLTRLIDNYCYFFEEP